MQLLNQKPMEISSPQMTGKDAKDTTEQSVQENKEKEDHKEDAKDVTE